MNCIEINKEDARDVRWLQDGALKEAGVLGREVLTCLSVEENGLAISADGFQLRVIPTPASLKEFSGKLVRLGAQPRLAGDVVKAEIIESGDFPGWREIIPNGKPTFEVYVNGAFLADIIKDMGGKMVKLEFFSPTAPMLIKSEDKFSVLMPMHHGDEELFFNPIAQLEESN